MGRRRVKIRPGLQVGKLLVESRSYSKLGKASYWNVVCDCKVKRIMSSAAILRANYRDCKCSKQRRFKARPRHGLSRWVVYDTWKAMIKRCHSPKSPSYKNYGARGIVVCEQWRSSFTQFRIDMGVRPDGTTLDRIDNDAGYSPENCRWATQDQQAANKRNTFYVQENGETHKVLSLRLAAVVKYSTLSARIRRGWSIADAQNLHPYGKNRPSQF